MVKKLFKHEFLFYARIMPIIYAILLTVATATRVIFIFESDTTAYQIIKVFSTIICGFSVFATFIFTFAMAIVRFYKNLFTCEGYLSFTLPVTAEQHIAVKAITAVTVNFVTLVVILLAGCILASGEMLTGILYDIETMMQLIFEQAGIHGVFFLIEYAVILVVASFTSIMLYYTFIAIGQLAKKNRILMAVGAYFIYYIISQVFATILTIALTVLATTDAFYELMYWIEMNPFTFVHIALCGGILLSTLFGLLEFVIIRWIITKKLNLE